ncbi:MAG: hypothetical protein ACE366_26465 [Bradymonadia bacterium]
MKRTVLSSRILWVIASGSLSAMGCIQARTMDPPEEIVDEADLMMCPEEHTRCYVPEPDEACPAFDKTDGNRLTEEEQEGYWRAYAEVIGTDGPGDCSWLEVGGPCADDGGERVCCYLRRLHDQSESACGRPFFISHRVRQAPVARRSDWV